MKSVSYIDGDESCIRVEVSPGIFNNVDSINIDLARVCCQVHASESISDSVIDLHSDNVSGVSTSDLERKWGIEGSELFYLEIVVWFLHHSEVICGLHEIESWQSRTVVDAVESDVSVVTASRVAEEASGAIVVLLPEDDDVDQVRSDSVEVGKGIFIDDEFAAKEHSPWGVAVEVESASGVYSGFRELDLKKIFIEPPSER